MIRFLSSKGSIPMSSIKAMAGMVVNNPMRVINASLSDMFLPELLKI